MMRYLSINDLKVSQIALGTATFGSEISDTEAFKLLDVYTQRGGNIVDTARFYAQWIENGENASERCLGRWIKKNDCRSKIVISSKGGHPPLLNMQLSRLTPEHIIGDLNESLSFLQTDYIDIYFLHRDDISIPVSEIMDCLHTLVKGKKIRVIGASNWSVKRIDEANKYAVANNKTPFSISQIQWSFAELNAENKVDKTMKHMDMDEYIGYAKNKLPIMAYTSQAKGFFSKYILDNNVNENMARLYVNAINKERCEKLIKLSEKYNRPVSQLGLAMLLNNEIKTIPIISTKDERKLMDSLDSCSINLSKDEIDFAWRDS